jgi:hypothetical protein
VSTANLIILILFCEHVVQAFGESAGDSVDIVQTAAKNLCTREAVHCAVKREPRPTLSPFARLRSRLVIRVFEFSTAYEQ